jgi:4'-phosphopantetheinyl transferase
LTGWPAGEVRVWRANLLEWLERPLSPHDLASLSEDECARADRILVEDARRRFLTSRILARSILGECTGQEPARIEFDSGPQGKPHVRGGDSIHFNISHSHHWWVIAVSRERDVGIDVEDWQRSIDIDRVAARLFAPEEVAVLQSLQGDQRRRAFFRVWTSREAVVKAMGEGIFASGHKFVVEADPTQPARVFGDELSLEEIKMEDGSPCMVAAMSRRAIRLQIQALKRPFEKT